MGIVKYRIKTTRVEGEEKVWYSPQRYDRFFVFWRFWNTINGKCYRTLHLAETVIDLDIADKEFKSEVVKTFTAISGK